MNISIRLVAYMSIMLWLHAKLLRYLCAKLSLLHGPSRQGGQRGFISRYMCRRIHRSDKGMFTMGRPLAKYRMLFPQDILEAGYEPMGYGSIRTGSRAVFLPHALLSPQPQ